MTDTTTASPWPTAPTQDAGHFDRAAAIHRHNPSWLPREQILALLRLGVDLPEQPDRNLFIEIDFERHWLDAISDTATDRPHVWEAEWNTTTTVPNRGIAALEQGPDFAIDVEEHTESGTLDDLADFIDEHLDRCDLDPGLRIKLCGWALWAQGLL